MSKKESKKEEGPQAADDAPTIMFDVSKDEMFNTNKGYKTLLRKFRTQYKIVQNKDDITKEILANVKAVIFAAPKKKFESEEIAALQEYMAEGGCVLLLGSEGKDGQSFLHVNKLTEEHGISISHDSVVRTVYLREYFHPKECFVKNTSLAPALDEISGKGKMSNVSLQFGNDNVDTGDKLSIVYPYGCSLKLNPPASPLFTSGSLSFPANRAICAWSQVKKGRLIVMGSASVFEDSYIVKADNSAACNAILKVLTNPSIKLDVVDSDRPEYNDRMEIPDTEALAERLRACLQEGEELPVDFTTLFDHTLFKYDTNVIPQAVKLYKKLNVDHVTLSLIPPQFEVPLPPLQPAVFMPCMRELPPPALDQFDLDEHFAGEKLRLAQLTNKCKDEDLEYYCLESGEILGVSDKIRDSKATHQKEDRTNIPVTAKQVLQFILQKLVNYKKMEQENNAHGSDPLATSMKNIGNAGLKRSVSQEKDDSSKGRYIDDDELRDALVVHE